MGGAGSRFSFSVPKPLIPLQNKPFFYWATQSITKFLEPMDITFVVLKEHVEKFSIDVEIHNFYPNAKVIIIPHVLNGAVLTCLEGVKDINDGLPLLFNDCDHTFICKSFYDFVNNKDHKSSNNNNNDAIKASQIDGALLTFSSTDLKYSFLDCKGYQVIRTVEKEVISNHAICGAYYFKNKDIFKASAKEYLDECSYSEYFMSGVYNAMINNGMKVSYFETDIHIPFGVPEELEIAKTDERLKLVC